MIGDESVENRRAIEHYGQVCVIGQIPMLEKISLAMLLAVYEKHFDQKAFQ
jgi:hypothetical protein